MATKPISAPDYTKIVQVVDAEDIFGKLSTIGLAELAARLGSPTTYERRGALIFADIFDSGLSKWNTDTSGAGASVALTALYASVGKYSAMLTAGSTLQKTATAIGVTTIMVNVIRQSSVKARARMKTARKGSRVNLLNRVNMPRWIS